MPDTKQRRHDTSSIFKGKVDCLPGYMALKALAAYFGRAKQHHARFSVALVCSQHGSSTAVAKPLKVLGGWAHPCFADTRGPSGSSRADDFLRSHAFNAFSEQVPNQYQERTNGQHNTSAPYRDRDSKRTASVSISWEAQEQEKHRWYRTDLIASRRMSVCPEHMGQPCDQNDQRRGICAGIPLRQTGGKAHEHSNMRGSA